MEALSDGVVLGRRARTQDEYLGGGGMLARRGFPLVIIYISRFIK